MVDTYQYSGRNTLKEMIDKDVNFKQKVINQAKGLAEKLNIEIEKGNDVFAFSLALSLAAFKDFLDVVLTFLLIGLIPGVTFTIGLFLTTFLFFFLLGKGFLLKLKAKFWFWFFGLFIDSIPGISVLPTNTVMVLLAWRTVKKRAEKGKLKLKNIAQMTEREITDLNNDISLLETAYHEE